MHFILWTSARRYTKSAIYIKFLTINIHNTVQSGTLVPGHFLSEEHTASTLQGVARHAGDVVSGVEERRFENDFRSFGTHNQQVRRSSALEVQYLPDSVHIGSITPHKIVLYSKALSSEIHFQVI